MSYEQDEPKKCAKCNRELRGDEWNWCGDEWKWCDEPCEKAFCYDCPICEEHTFDSEEE